ncbi:hypothetical protein [Candidatus Pelagibacter sp.]|uniref:hypothetical protein n=1 Tax=Candidatus Pelagibacter sp. TaxID=2024849 RepID=UPI003F8448AA
MTEFIGVLFTPVVNLLDFLFNTVGYALGIIIMVGIPLGILYAIYLNVKDITRSKSAFKEFLTVSLPITILMIIIGLGLGYCVVS